MSPPLISDDISLAVKALQNGNVVAFPTETVYGIGADSANPEAIRRIYEIKQRDYTVPLQVLVGSLEEAEELGEFNDIARKLAKEHWPGPLTIVVRHKNNIKATELASNVSAGQDTIGIRIPDHPTALSLIQQLGRPIASSSANISGQKPAIYAEEIQQSFTTPQLQMILNSITPPSGLASTVVDATSDKIPTLREGAITEESLYKLTN